MATPANIDSWHYIIAYELPTACDVPSDFGQMHALRDFHTGLFLPRGEPDWFGRSAYPPRVLALVPSGLAIVPHPAAKASSHLVPFEQLCFVESGHILLRGWLRFVGNDFDRILVLQHAQRGGCRRLYAEIQEAFRARRRVQSEDSP